MRHYQNRDVSLFLALGGHTGADLLNEPALEFLARFQRAPTHDQSVRVECIDHFVEEKPEAVSLHPENIPAQGISLVGEAPHQLGGLVHVRNLGKIVPGIAGQEKWQQGSFNRGKRAHRLQVAAASAIAGWFEAVESGDALVRDQDVAHLTSESFSSLHYVTVDNYSPAEASSDYNRDRCFPTVGSENRKVSPKSARVAIV